MSNILMNTNRPSQTAEGETTLTGIVRAFFVDLNSQTPKLDVLNRGWNADTQERYRADYTERLIPALGDRAVSSYTEEEILDRLQKLGSANEYMEGTMAHYRHLTYVLFAAAEQLGVCENVLWGSELGLLDEDHEVFKLKKSFSVAEQISIYHTLNKPPAQILGQELGLLLMNEAGLRNNEACGLNYGSFQPLVAYPEIYTLKIYQTTKLKSSELKAGGKTRNANRLLPLMPILSRRLLQQRAYLEKLVETGAFVLPEGTSIDTLPIVCYGRDFLQRCKADDLTRAGKQLFRSVGIREKAVQRLDALIHSDEFREEDFEEEELKEKAPTTYLFRRNYVTYLDILNFTPSELEYYIGHMVEDDFKTRNSFVNEDKQAELAAKLERHPLNWILMENEFSWENPKHLQCEAEGRIVIRAPPESRIGLRFTAKEPEDKVRICMDGAHNAVARTMTAHLEFERTVDVRKKLLEEYRRNQKYICS